MAFTIKDIARESGYAISTVSRALNDHPDVSPEAKARINEIVQAHNFVPNKNAKRLKQTTSKSIAVMVKGHFNLMFASLVERMQAIIEKTDYTVHIHYLEEEDDEVMEAVRHCAERKHIGVIFLGGNFQNFRNSFDKLEIPCVLVTNSDGNLGFKNLSSVTIDDTAAARCAMDYILEKGHKRVGIVGGMVEMSQTSHLRYEGCLESIKAHGADFNFERDYQRAWYSYKSAYEAMNKLLDRAPDITAVFTMSDVMAIGAIRAAIDRGLNVPKNISVFGFDGVELAGFYNPKLTTIKQPDDILAQRGIEIILNSVERHAEAVHEIVDFKLIEGESVGFIHA